MKIFGLTTVDTYGFDGGKESATELFASEDEAINYAFKEYEKAWKDCDFVDGSDENGDIFLPKAEFANQLRKGYVLIQRPDSHVQYELFNRHLFNDFSTDRDKKIAAVLTELMRAGISDEIYTALRKEHIRDDACDYIVENNYDGEMPEDKETFNKILDLGTKIAELYVSGEYDCNLDYWSNIKNLLERVVVENS